MNGMTLYALKQSIKKWEKTAKLTSAKKIAETVLDNRSCPLCEMFNQYGLNYGNRLRCDGCPVYEKTGEQFCDDTPFVKVHQVHQDLQDAYYHDIKPIKHMASHIKKFKEAAQKEANYLKKLLPKKEK